MKIVSMVFTVGNTVDYLRYFKEQKNPQKAVGGSVWKTYNEAEKYCKKGFSVFGVKVDWEKDTIPNKNGNWHDLLVVVNLVRL